MLRAESIFSLPAVSARCIYCFLSNSSIPNSFGFNVLNCYNNLFVFPFQHQMTAAAVFWQKWKIIFIDSISKHGMTWLSLKVCIKCRTTDGIVSKIFIIDRMISVMQQLMHGQEKMGVREKCGKYWKCKTNGFAVFSYISKKWLYQVVKNQILPRTGFDRNAENEIFQLFLVSFFNFALHV